MMVCGPTTMRDIGEAPAAAPCRRALLRTRMRQMSEMSSRSLRLGLDVHLPGAAEQVEVVHVEAAQRGLQRGEDVADRHAQRLRLVAVDVEEEPRAWWPRRWRRPACSARILVGGDHQRRSIALPSSAGSRPCQVLQLVFEAAAGAEADDRRQVEGDDLRRAHRGAGAEHPADGGDDARPAGPVRWSKAFSRATMKAELDCAPPVDQAEADDGRARSRPPGMRLEDVLDLLAPPRGCATSEAACGQLDLRRRRRPGPPAAGSPAASSSRWRRCAKARPAVSSSESDGDADQPRDDRGIAVPHLVDAAQRRSL